MKVHVEANPLHEPLAGGTPGATVSLEPIVAGQVTWSRSMMESPGGRFLQREAAARPAHRPTGDDGAVPRLPDPPPERRGDPRRYRPPSLDRNRRRRELRPARCPLRQADARARGRRAGAAARARPRPGRDPDRRHDPPAPRPQLGDLRVPQLDLRRQRSRVEGRHRRFRARCSTATAAPTSTTPSTTARSTSTAAASTPTPPSAAPSTSSATARSASPTRPATAPATSR